MLDFNRLEALIELMFLAAYADGAVQEEERKTLWDHVVAGSHGRLSQDSVTMMLTAIEEALKQEGREARFASIKRRLREPKLCLAALATAASIIHADRIVDAREAAWMARAADALGVPVDEALALLSPR